MDKDKELYEDLLSEIIGWVEEFPGSDVWEDFNLFSEICQEHFDYEELKLTSEIIKQLWDDIQDYISSQGKEVL